MTKTVSVTRKFTVTRAKKGSRTVRSPEAQAERPKGRLPRVTKLMAMAIRFDLLIREGVVADQAEIARLGFVSRARVTQVMNLLNLAPEIQKAILALAPVQAGRDAVTERQLRTVGKNDSWKQQAYRWRSLIAPREQTSMQ